MTSQNKIEKFFNISVPSIETWDGLMFVISLIKSNGLDTTLGINFSKNTAILKTSIKLNDNKIQYIQKSVSGDLKKGVLGLILYYIKRYEELS